MGVRFDPRDPATIADPHPAERELRERDPVHPVPGAGLWFVSRHADARAVLRDDRVSARQGQRLRARRGDLPDSMLTSDDPDHRRLRGAATAAFTPARLDAAITALRPRIAGLLDAVGDRARHGAVAVEAVEELARPVAVAALAIVLGLSDDDERVLKSHAAHLGDQLDPFADPVPGGPAQVAIDAVDDLLARVLFDRLRSPREDALSVLAAAYDRGEVSAAEAVATASLLVVGGIEPLAQALAGLFATLAAADPTARPPVDGLVEEVLRLESPIPFTARRTRADLQVGDRVVPAGDGIVVLFGSANRDAARFDDPDRLDPSRRPNPHLAFGAGPHTCIGAALTRRVMGVVVEEVRARGMQVRPGREQPTRTRRAVPRGLARLPLQVRLVDAEA